MSQGAGRIMQVLPEVMDEGILDNPVKTSLPALLLQTGHIDKIKNVPHNFH
jgi:hypothetical protein